ncbi:hypothetical protein YW7DRAFT_01419 [Streptomyces sp. AmelKG-E11A]|nr:hypothetical protein YW7DRAFT_01419 [Streptomyces sp. AmelKG-E11A]
MQRPRRTAAVVTTVLTGAPVAGALVAGPAKVVAGDLVGIAQRDRTEPPPAGPRPGRWRAGHPVNRGRAGPCPSPGHGPAPSPYLVLPNGKSRVADSRFRCQRGYVLW